MKLEKLLENIKIHNVPSSWYSLDGELKPDASIIFQNYNKWECFYMDEKGNRSQFVYFYSPEEAYDWLWERIKYLLNFFG